MAFNREGAKAAGYSDAEIDYYLAQKELTAPSVPRQFTPPAGKAEDVPIEANPLLNPIELGIDAASMPLARGGKMIGTAVSRLMRGGAEAAAEHAPTVARVGGTVVKEGARAVGRRVLGDKAFDSLTKAVVKSATKKVAKTAAEDVGTAASRTAAKAIPRSAGRIPMFNRATGAWYTQAEREAMGLEKAAGSAASRVARKAAPKAAAKAEEAVAETAAKAKPYRPRGASKPELARRAADRARAVAGKKVAGKIGPSGSAASRVTAKKAAQEESRHAVQYFSKSQGKYIDIEGMNQKHIEQAYRQLAATKPKAGSVAKKILDALLDESKHRLSTTGIHIGQGG